MHAPFECTNCHITLYVSKFLFTPDLHMSKITLLSERVFVFTTLNPFPSKGFPIDE